MLRAPTMFLVCIIVLSSNGFAQNSVEDQVRENDAITSRSKAMERDGLSSRRQPKLSARGKMLLTPPADLKDIYSSFLRQPHTGLLRLLPREVYEGKLPIRGGGAYYSFKRRTHEYGYGSDLSLEQGEFKVGFAGADLGFLVDLGNEPLENLGVETDGISYLAKYAPPNKESEARPEFRKIQQGLSEGGWKYKTSVPALADHSYAVRAINYGESDYLVVFRVVRMEANGSMDLLWKVLKVSEVPVLEQGV